VQLERDVTERKDKPEPAVSEIDEVFDRVHLGRYTMNDEALEREILGLFLAQLKTTVEMIGKAETAAEWKLWTHTLKGAAAAVGARHLQQVAIDLEGLPFSIGAAAKPKHLAVLAQATAEFRQRVARDFPQLAA
jgi:HPt (histidine-containing phosphotransfer) domain-containing protein